MNEEDEGYGYPWKTEIPLEEHDAFYEEHIEPKGGWPTLSELPDYYDGGSAEIELWEHAALYDFYVEPKGINRLA